MALIPQGQLGEHRGCCRQEGPQGQNPEAGASLVSPQTECRQCGWGVVTEGRGLQGPVMDCVQNTQPLGRGNVKKKGLCF